MGSFSVWHWLIVLIWIAVFVVPTWRIVRRAGFPGGWALLALIPLVNIVMLWIFAFAKWPIERQSA
jgi:hypothetical protein